MERLDPEMKRLVAQLKNAPDTAAKNIAEGLIKARVEVLSPIYHQVAVQFADLHDTPSRMMAKGVIRCSVFNNSNFWMEIILIINIKDLN